MSAVARHTARRPRRPMRRRPPTRVQSRRAPAQPQRRKQRQLPAIFTGLVLAALALASLRIDIMRMGYDLADSIAVEKTLLEERRTLTAGVRALRNPRRLNEIARRRGLSRPERVIDLRGSSGTP